MTTRSFYKPLQDYVVGLKHPDGNIKMEKDGAWWVDDAFTFALVRDGVLEKSEDQESQKTPDYTPAAMFGEPRTAGQK
jgi:hypothetical protein